MSARELLDDPEFAGLVFQHWHVAGDERQPWGPEHYAPRTVGEDIIDRWLSRQSDEFTVRPVRWHRPPCEVCGGAGGVQAHQNGRTGTHPCPTGCRPAARYSDIVSDGGMDPRNAADAAASAPVERLRRALALMMEVQTMRRKPLGEPTEGIAWKAANAMALAREAMGGDGEAELPAALADNAALRAELVAMGWTPPESTAYIVLSDDGQRIRYWSGDHRQATGDAKCMDRALVPVKALRDQVPPGTPGRLVAPDGSAITGRQEVVPGTVGIVSATRGPSGALECELDGHGTCMWWDDQKPVTRGNKAVYVTDDGSEYTEGQLVLAPLQEEATDGEPPEPGPSS